MKKVLLMVLCAMCAMTLNAQKYIDSNNVLWNLHGDYEAAQGDHNGLSVTTDSLKINVRPMYTGLIELCIDNDGKSPVKVIWDESTLDGEAIVFGDMMKFQIGSPIKPSIIESGSYLLKEMTTESLARYNKPYVDMELAKSTFKKVGYMGYLMTIYLCIEKNGTKTRHKVCLQGLFINKKFKDDVKDKANESQDFKAIDEVFEKAMQ